MTGYPDLVVLVVDDDPNCREVLARLFSKVARCRVVEASNGAEGFNAVAAERPDLIFLDLMMPEVDGEEMLARIRAHPHLSDIPVIVCSAMDELNHVKGIIELGILDYVLKPYSLDTLFAKLKAALEKISTRPRSRRATEVEGRSQQPPDQSSAVRKLLLVTDDVTLFREVRASVDPDFCCLQAQDRATAIKVATAERPEAIFLVSPLAEGEERSLARELRSLSQTQPPKLFRIFSTGAVDVRPLEECDGSFILTGDHRRLFEWIHQCLGPGPFRFTREPGTLVVQLYNQNFEGLGSHLLDAIDHHRRSTGDRRVVFDITAWQESGTSRGTELDSIIARLKALGFEVSLLGGPNQEASVKD